MSPSRALGAVENLTLRLNPLRSRMLGIYPDIYTTFRLIARANSPNLLLLLLLLLLAKEVNAVIITIICGRSSYLLARYNFDK